MAGKNITIAGAVFNGVPSIDVPVSGGGTASFVEISDTTAAAADVASGKYFYTAAGIKTEGTASGGGGGASNIVTGTFKGTTTGAALDVTLNYSGSGFPVAIVIYPKDGYQQGSAIYDLVQRYAVVLFEAMKPNLTPPTYSTTSMENTMYTYVTNKNSATTGSSTASGGSTSGNTLRNISPSASARDCVKIKDKTTLSVFIANTSYGFPAGYEFTYYIIYSS